MRDVHVRFPRVELAGRAMLLIVTLSGCSAIHQVEIDRRIDQMIATAKSPADHEAIAAAYEEEAARNREQAAAHLKIAQSYEGRPHVKFAATWLRTIPTSRRKMLNWQRNSAGSPERYEPMQLGRPAREISRGCFLAGACHCY